MRLTTAALLFSVCLTSPWFYGLKICTYTGLGTVISIIFLFIYLFRVFRRFQHCAGHITMGSWKGRGNQYIQLVKVLYCKLPTIGRKLPSFPHRDLNLRPQRWEASSYDQHPSCEISGTLLPASEVGGESVTTQPPWPPIIIFLCI